MSEREEASERRKILEERLASRQQNHRIVSTSDDGAPERIRLVKREGIFDGRWYYPDAAIMPFDAEFEYIRADLAATRMRERCVSAIKAALADARRSWPASRATTEYELGARGAFTAALSAIESLTLDGKKEQ